MRRIVGLVGLFKRKHFQEKETGLGFINQIAARMETRTVTPAHFDTTSTPMVHAADKERFHLCWTVRARVGAADELQM